MIETLIAELEQLFELEELLSICQDILGFDPQEIGGTGAKGSFAQSLVEHCRKADAVEALCDAVLASKDEVSPAIAEIAANGLAVDTELRSGDELGDYVIVRRLGQGRLGTSYVARYEGTELRLKVLHPNVGASRSDVFRFLTVNRLLSEIGHAALPQEFELYELDGGLRVVHEFVEGQALSTRIARGGPMHINEAHTLIEAILAPSAWGSIGSMRPSRNPTGASSMLPISTLPVSSSRRSSHEFSMGAGRPSARAQMALSSTISASSRR